MVAGAISKGKQCRTLGGRLCTLHTKRPGEPIVLSQRCPYCAEWRCRTHCKCGREGTATGRSAPRARRPVQQPRAVAKAAPKAHPQPQPQPQPLAPVVGRPAAMGVDVISDGSWLSKAIDEIRDSADVMLMSYVYDSPDLQNAFLRRLRGTSPFKLTVLVDKENFDQRSAVHQRPRLRDLHNEGATIFTVSGDGRFGSLHAKCLLIDRRIAYQGSANFTLSAQSNLELMTRLVGPPAREIERFFMSCKARRSTRLRDDV